MKEREEPKPVNFFKDRSFNMLTFIATSKNDIIVVNKVKDLVLFN